MSAFKEIIQEASANEFDPTSMPNGYNGHMTMIDMSKPIDSIARDAKLVLAQGGGICLTRSVAYCIWAAQGFPEVATAVTEEHLTNAMAQIALVMARHTMLCMFHVAQIAIAVRSSDMLSVAKFDVIDGSLALKGVAKAVCDRFADDETFAQAQMGESRYVILCLIANAIHRKQNEGHNWFTKNGNVKGTNTHRALAIGGEFVEGFARFMDRGGHDLWHFLTDKTLVDIADAVTGTTDKIVVGAFTYNGANIVGHKISEVFEIGSAAMDRYPPGIMGKGAIMVGLMMLRAMIVYISMKVVIDDVGILINAIDVEAAIVAGIDDRKRLMDKKDKLQKTIVMAYGFFTSDPANQGNATDNKAIASVASRDLSSKLMGASMYNHVSSIEGDTDAIASSFSAFFTTVKASIGAPADDFAVPVIAVPMTFTQSIMNNMINGGGMPALAQVAGPAANANASAVMPASAAMPASATPVGANAGSADIPSLQDLGFAAQTGGGGASA